MLQITPYHHIHLAVKPVDFRKGITGLSALCKILLQSDPFSGHIFVFRNRLATNIKLLVYDGNGFWCCHKRFSQGKLAWWPTSHDTRITIPAVQLQVLLQQGSPEAVALGQDWRSLSS